VLRIELFIFIRSLPQFSSNIFEELERIEPYLEVLRLEKDQEPTSEAGWILVYDGKLALPGGKTFERGGPLYLGRTKRVQVVESSTVIFFSETRLDKFLKEEPELAVSLVEQMKAFKMRWERNEI
tara:strand:- start:71 stop:445 length:375 start_codon:yes stop_codon:yes gene_type:complete